jgi:hypothetical protein
LPEIMPSPHSEPNGSVVLDSSEEDDSPEPVLELELSSEPVVVGDPVVVASPSSPAGPNSPVSLTSCLQPTKSKATATG